LSQGGPHHLTAVRGEAPPTPPRRYLKVRGKKKRRVTYPTETSFAEGSLASCIKRRIMTRKFSRLAKRHFQQVRQSFGSKGMGPKTDIQRPIRNGGGSVATRGFPFYDPGVRREGGEPEGLKKGMGAISPAS